MTLQQMRYFIGAAESGSISEAAKRSFTAQSSISGAIKEVENTYGITAFVRDSKGVRLTRSGEELLIEFKWILNRLDYLDDSQITVLIHRSVCLCNFSDIQSPHQTRLLCTLQVQTAVSYTLCGVWQIHGLHLLQTIRFP